jgi:TolA-binding protein
MPLAARLVPLAASRFMPLAASHLLAVAVVVITLTAIPVRAGEADDQYAVAAGHYTRRQWTPAAEEFQTFLDKYPAHKNAPSSVFFLAEALLQLDRLDEAHPRFREYVRRAPKGQFARAALFRAGETAYLTKRFDRAKTDLKEFDARYPADKLGAYLLPYLGEIALAQNDPAAAVEYFRRCLERFPHGRLQDDCRLGLARALQRRGRHEEAERLLAAVAAKSVGRLADEAQFQLGRTQFAAGRFAEAVETLHRFETDLAGSPRLTRARLVRALALMKLDRPAEARTLLQKIASEESLGVEARYWIGLSHKAEQDWPAAAETLLALAAEHPAHELAAAVRFHAADALLRAGRLPEAVEQFDLVIDTTPIDNEWLDDAVRGKVQAALRAKGYKTLDRLAAEFTGQFPTSPLRADVERMLGRSLLEREQFGRAIEVLEPLVQSRDGATPGLEDHYLLALAYEGAGRWEEGLAAIEPVLQSAEEGSRLRADARLAQGSLLVALKRFDEAVKPLEQFLSTESDGDGPNGDLPDGDIIVKGKAQLAICHAKAKEFGKAKRLCDELLREHGTHELVAPAVMQLAEDARAGGAPAWSAELFAWLADRSGRREYMLKGLLGLGWSQYDSGRLVLAAETFKRLLDEKPSAGTAAEAALARGRILEQLARHDPALAMYALVIDRYPDRPEHPKALLAAARLHDRLEQDEQAAGLYERLARKYPKHPDLDAVLLDAVLLDAVLLDTVLYEWSWVLHDLGRAEASGRLLTRLYEEHPKSRYWADAVYRLARAAFDASDHARASALVDEMLAAEPSDEIAQHALCLRWRIAASGKRWDEVRRASERLVAEHPQSPMRLAARFWTAEAIYRQGRYKEAGRRLDDLSRSARGRDEPWLAMIPLRRAQVLAHGNQWNEAYGVASKIRAKFPQSDQLHEVDYLIGRCLAARAEFERAREAYRRVIRSPRGAKTETAAMAQWMIGETYFHQKDYEAAVRAYLRLEILYAYPEWQAAALLQAGKCHELRGRPREAAELYTQLRKSYPDAPFVEEANRRLQIVR